MIPIFAFVSGYHERWENSCCQETYGKPITQGERRFSVRSKAYKQCSSSESSPVAGMLQ